MNVLLLDSTTQPDWILNRERFQNTCWLLRTVSWLCTVLRTSRALSWPKPSGRKSRIVERKGIRWLLHLLSINQWHKQVVLVLGTKVDLAESRKVDSGQAQVVDCSIERWERLYSFSRPGLSTRSWDLRRSRPWIATRCTSRSCTWPANWTPRQTSRRWRRSPPPSRGRAMSTGGLSKTSRKPWLVGALASEPV